MKRSELNDEAKAKVDEYVDEWIEEIEGLPKSDPMELDGSLKEQLTIEKKYKALIREIIEDERNRKS